MAQKIGTVPSEATGLYLFFFGERQSCIAL